MYDNKVLIKNVESVLHEVAYEQIRLLKTGRVERTFSTRLRDSLLPLFTQNGLTVDAPYNRHLEGTKRIDGRVIELDIAIHEPFTDDKNLIAIEIETNNKPLRDDIDKLKYLTNQDEEYRYQLGLYVVFGIEAFAGKLICLEWYADGELIAVIE